MHYIGIGILFTVFIAVGLNPIFGQDLRSYFIECNQDDFDYIVNHPNEDRAIPCTILFDGGIWRNVTISLRGESSRNYPKKSFRLNFPPDNRFYGRDKMNLVAEWTDATFSRDYLSYDAYRRAGLFASRAWHTRVNVNRRYIGLYLDVEEVDNHFLEPAGLPTNSTVYKAEENGCLLSPTEPVERLYYIRANAGEGFAALRRIIEWIEHTRDEDFFATLDNWFNRNELARVIALNALLGNSSTYYHNYFLIREPGEMGRWHILPWDMDFTWYYSDDFSEPKYYRSGHQTFAGDNRLITRCWRDPRMRERIFEQMNNLIDSGMTREILAEQVNDLRERLADAAEQDTFKQYGMDLFHQQLAEIPDKIHRRGQRILFEAAEFPLPFGVDEPLVGPNGLYISWDHAITANNDTAQYEVWISPEVLFRAGERRRFEGIVGNSILIANPIPEGFIRVYAITDGGRRAMAIPYFTIFQAQEQHIGGHNAPSIISRDTTWRRDDGAVRLPEGLFIQRGARLTIEAGLMVGVGIDAAIRVEGELVVGRLNGDSTHFRPLEPEAGWRGFIVREGELTLNRVHIAGTAGDTVRGQQPSAVFAERAQVDIARSRITGGAWDGVVVSDSRLMMRDTRVDHFGGNLIKAHASRVNLNNLTLDHADEKGIRADILDIDESEAGMRLTNLTLFGPADDGIDLDGCDSILIESVRIVNAVDNGISLGGASRAAVIRNVVATNCGSGVAVHDSSSAVVYNAVLAFNDEGLAVRRNRAADVRLRNSVLWRNGIEIVTEKGGIVNAAFSVIRGDTLYPGQAIINRDAHFIDQWGQDFHPREDAPLIDAGWADEWTPPFDITGAERRDAAGIPNTGAGANDFTDIGVYEFGSAAGVNELGITPLPEEFGVIQTYPNPFNGRVQIRFNLPQVAKAKVEIFSINGRLVFTKQVSSGSSGNFALNWNGLSQSGTLCPTGVYLISAVGGRQAIYGKVLLLR